MAEAKAAVCGRRIAGHCPWRARRERQIRDLCRSGARFPRESLAAALEICVSTKKKNQRARRRGAHLHYEIQTNGRPVDPATWPATKRAQLVGADLALFRKQINASLAECALEGR